MKSILFAISLIFLIAGAVNLGAFGIFPAIPFLFLMLFLMVKNRGKYLIAGVISIILVGAVYFIRTTKREIFLNSLGREVVTLKNLCLTKYRGQGTEDFVLAMEMKNEKDCDSSNMGDAINF